VSLPAADPTSRGQRLPLRPLSFAVLFLVAAIAVAGFVVTRQVVRDQEHRLLKQRNDEAGLYLSSAINGIGGTLSSIAGAALLSHEDPVKFQQAATPLTQAKGGFKSILLMRTTPVPAVIASAGLPLGGVADVQAKAALQAEQVVHTPAGATGALVSTPLYDGPGKVKRIGFAYATPLLPGYVVYAASEVRPQDPTPATNGAPFSELAVAIYAGTKVQADQLILVSAGVGHLPISGTKATTKVAIGAGAPWLMVAKARHPLVGSVATATPWALLAAGLLAALLATAVVETLSRRREYALAVADARTKELKQSLEELAAAHEQLVRQERLAAIGELASTIGHELRNPLGVISNALYLLRSDVAKAPSEPASRHLATAEREVSAATVIVSDLLEFARQRDPVMTDVDTVALVDEVLGVLPPPTGVTVERRPAPGPVIAVADRDMLRQVLLNVIGNGYQAMPEGGTMTVSVAEDATGAQLRISDTGVGMTEDVRHKLFEPFFTTKARGVGLGLAVCKRIIDAHGGTITVDSEPGAGSTFTVTVPQMRVPRQSSAADQSANEPASEPLGVQQ
jgi:signal transduction histidine kinase